MKYDKRSRLVSGVKPGLTLKGLTSRTVREAPVDLVLDGEAVGRYHALELYQQVSGTNRFPQIISDLISNTYLRLTCPNPDGSSATFGSSFVGAPSFRQEDGRLNFIPEVSQASASSIAACQLSITLKGSYGPAAELISIRSYRTDANDLNTVAQVEIRLKIITDITLDKSQAGRDRFRLCTISSMYAGPDCYDGNMVRSGAEGPLQSINLKDEVRRTGYLFAETPRSSHVRLIKESGSRGGRHNPGSPDSPSLVCRVLSSNIPLSEIGFQGYLINTTDFNEDSLSVWLEWIDCPDKLTRGQEIWAKLELSALHPFFKQ